MKQHRGKLFSATVLVISLVLGGFGCTISSAGALDLIKKGAENYSDGKSEVEYLTNDTAGQVLTSLIESYTANRENPQPIDEDEAKTIADDTDEEDKVIQGSAFEIGSDDDVKRAIHIMFDDSKSVFECEVTGGYILDNNAVLRVLERAEQEDPIDGFGVMSYCGYMVGSSGTINLNYFFDTQTLRIMKQESRSLVSAAVSDLNYLKGQPEVRVVYYVNEYLCDKIVYPPEDRAAYPDTEGYAPESHTIWSALKYGSAVCDGYARSARVILEELGVKSDIVYGVVAGGGLHAWNVTNVDDAWYHLDVCWNDGSYSRQDYFLLTDSDMRKERSWNYGTYPPSAGSRYDYQGKV